MNLWQCPSPSCHFSRISQRSERQKPSAYDPACIQALCKRLDEEIRQSPDGLECQSSHLSCCWVKGCPCTCRAGRRGRAQRQPGSCWGPPESKNVKHEPETQWASFLWLWRGGWWKWQRNLASALSPAVPDRYRGYESTPCSRNNWEGVREMKSSVFWFHWMFYFKFTSINPAAVSRSAFPKVPWATPPPSSHHPKVSFPAWTGSCGFHGAFLSADQSLRFVVGRR